MEKIDVAVIMGSDSDLELGKASINALKKFDLSGELKVISAHRSPDVLVEYLKSSKERGCKAYIAIAGMAAHLAGAIACLLYTSPSPRDRQKSRMPSSA